MLNNKPNKSKRGFASMDPARQREIASQGGIAAHEKGTAHKFTSKEAAVAGRKGGQTRKSLSTKQMMSSETAVSS